MTAEELIRQLNVRYGLAKWPETFEVNSETYAYACAHVIKNKTDRTGQVVIELGPKDGLMFKGIELIELRKR